MREGIWLTVAFGLAIAAVPPAAIAQTSPFQIPPGESSAPPPDGGRLEPSRKTPRPVYIPEQPGNALLVTEYLGRPVYGPDKQKIGTISNVLVDISGRVTGFVVEVGGFLGIGAKEVAISFEAVIPVREDDQDFFLVEMTRAQLTAAPAFKRAK